MWALENAQSGIRYGDVFCQSEAFTFRARFQIRNAQFTNAQNVPLPEVGATKLVGA